ncbi:putative rRNA maturation factor [Desulfitispora alkaliphila]
MELTIINQQEKVNFGYNMERILKEAVQVTLAEHGNDSIQVEVSALLVDDQEISSLNRDYRDIDSATDVLSFPQYEKIEQIMHESEASPHPILLGDIVISLETCVRQAEEYGHSAERELGFLVVHGMLHLLGYDHLDDEEKIKMRSKEEQVLTKMGLGR